MVSLSQIEEIRTNILLHCLKDNTDQNNKNSTGKKLRHGFSVWRQLLRLTLNQYSANSKGKLLHFAILNGVRTNWSQLNIDDVMNVQLHVLRDNVSLFTFQL